MWPAVDLENGRIESDYSFHIKQPLETEDIEIKEIIMLFGDYDSLSYSHNDVAWAVSYSIDFGHHIILFSKVTNLEYDIPMNWSLIFSSNPNGKNSEFVSSETLTKMFHNLLHDIRDKEEREKLLGSQEPLFSEYNLFTD